LEGVVDAGQKAGWEVGSAQVLIGKVGMKEVDGQEEREVGVSAVH
jgi:hypothetical protein